MTESVVFFFAGYENARKPRCLFLWRRGSQQWVWFKLIIVARSHVPYPSYVLYRAAHVYQVHDKKAKLPPQYYRSQLQLRAWSIIYASATPLNPHLPIMTVKYQHALHLLNLCASQTSWAVQPVSHYCYTYIILYVLQDFGPRSRKNFGSTKHAFGTECTLYLAALVVCPGGDLRRKAAETTKISWQAVSPHLSIIPLNYYKELRIRPALAGTHSPWRGEGV